MKKILLVKFLLCANPYLFVFFKILMRQGLSSDLIVRAISIGTLIMIIGDGVSSLLVDRYGPKFVIFFTALLQVISLLYLCYVRTYSDLILFEVLMGLSFPAIYGADSKWLKYLVNGKESEVLEKYNQLVFWLSQLLSACIGGFFAHYDLQLCKINSLLFATGGLLCLGLKNIPQNSSTVNKNNVKILETINFAQCNSILLFGGLLGGIGTSSWLLQLEVEKTFRNIPYLFCVTQIAGAFLSLAGSYFSLTFSRGWIFGALSSLFLFGLASIMHSSIILWLAIGGGLCARGGISVLARAKILSGIEGEGPIATYNFLLGGCAKLVQASLLVFLTKLY